MLVCLQLHAAVSVFHKEFIQINPNFGDNRGGDKCQVTLQYISSCHWNALIRYKLVNSAFFLTFILLLNCCLLALS